MSVQVPTSDEFDFHRKLIDNLNSLVSVLENDIDTLGSEFDSLKDVPKSYRPETYRQSSDSDWTLAFQRMFADIEKNLRVDAGGSVSVADGYVALSAASYGVSEPFMTKQVGRAQGLTFRGLGKRTSEIVFTGTGNLFENYDRWMGVRFYDLSFRGVGGSGNFLYSFSSNMGANQDWNFTNVEWRGAWKNGIILDGPDPSNTNSEWVFDRCTVIGSYTGSFLYSGATPSISSQDQFLNFWFSKCKLEWSGGNLLTFARGGSVVVRDCSIIMTGKNQKVFYAPQAPSSHADSVQHLLIDACRIEPRDITNTIVDSTWKGTQRFTGLTDNAWAYRSGNESVILYHFTNPSRVAFEDCTFAGKHQYTQTVLPSQQSIRYIGCARTESTNRNLGFWVQDGTFAGLINIHVQLDGDMPDQIV